MAVDERAGPGAGDEAGERPGGEESTGTGSGARPGAGSDGADGSSDVAPSGRLEGTFAELRRRGRSAFVPYLPHGYPHPDETPRLLRRLAQAGADVIELGVPFSDPLADGPTIQRATWKALEHGVRLEDTLALLEETAGDLPPVVLFTYLNPVLRTGVERFLERASAAGAAGILITDLPVGTDPELEQRLACAGPDLIRLIAPTTPDRRLETIVETASGFLYYISRTGVTGERDALEADLGEQVARLRRRVRLPVAVGFGISRPAHAREVAEVADGVVVGSALVSALGRDEEAFAELAGALARATHGDG